MATSPQRTALSSTTANKSPSKPSTASSFSTASDASFTDPSAGSMAENQLQSEKEQNVKSMEYHRQVLKGKLEDDSALNKYVSPSDNIMSPCTQKLSALKGKQFGKAKPKSLFAQTAGKNVGTSGMGDEGNNRFAASGEKGAGKGA
ncbi:hypothetical protein G7Y79_00050g085560 [Physcia stellaris]|nr:hypothetical protein G7Y79_00050g085560 [Physcia stellaris]